MRERLLVIPRDGSSNWMTKALLVWITAAILSLTGCLPGGEGVTPSPSFIDPSPVPATPVPTPLPTQSRETGMISIWLDWEPYEMEGLHEVIEEFQTRYPDVRFSIAYHPAEKLEDNFRNAMESGEGPTVLLGPSRWGPSLLEEGWIIDIHSLIDAELERIVEPVAWAQGRRSRVAYGLPVELQGMLLYRNTSLVGEAVKTEQEFIEAARELRSKSSILTILDFGFINSASQMSACGASLYDEMGDYNFIGENGGCWLEFLKTLGRAGQIQYDVDEDRTRFIRGEGAWLIEQSELLDDLEDQIGRSNLDVDSWPVYTETERAMSGFVWTENAYLVSGDSQLDQEVSWAFIRFLLTPDAQNTLSETGGADHLPVVNNVEVSDPLRAKALATLRRGSPLPLEEELPLLAEPLVRAVDAVAVQGADTEFSLLVALERITTALEDADQEG